MNLPSTDRDVAIPLAERIDAVLPQMQCGRCGHPACLPYANAIAGGAPLNRCAPGGAALIAALAAISSRPAAPVDPAFGAEGPLRIARIDDRRCIGCTLCRDACPVDAISGGPKRLHAVVAAWCTGCALCVPPCPVDCIVLVPAGRAWSPADGDAARLRHRQHTRRLEPVRAVPATDAETPGSQHSPAQRRAAIAAALDRARARRNPPGTIEGGR